MNLLVTNFNYNWMDISKLISSPSRFKEEEKSKTVEKTNRSSCLSCACDGKARKTCFLNFMGYSEQLFQSLGVDRTIFRIL